MGDVEILIETLYVEHDLDLTMQMENLLGLEHNHFEEEVVDLL